MAGNYEALGSYPDVEFLGGTATRLVQVFRIRTLPHGVYVEWRLPQNLLAGANVDQARSDVATAYENLFGHTGIADVAWGQRVAPSQQLFDTLTLFVSSASGQSSNTLTFDSQPWNPDPWLAAAATLSAQLDATEG